MDERREAMAAQFSSAPIFGKENGMQDDALLTIKDVAGALRLSERTVWRKEVTGELPPAIRIGGAVRWSASSVREWINRKQAEAERRRKIPRTAG